MSKPRRSPREERDQAKRSKQDQRDRRKKRGREKKASSSSEGEGEPTRQSPSKPPPRRSPRIRAPAPAAAPAPAPAAAPAPAPARPVIVPREYSPSQLNADWLVSAGRPEEAALVVHPFADYPAPPLGTPWARCGFARGWEPGWGWAAIPAWLRVRHEAQGFDPTNPANVRQLEKELAICKKYNLRPHCPFSMLTPTGFGRRLLARAEVETDRARARELRAAERKLCDLRGKCEKYSNPGPEDRARYGCCECCGFVCTVLLRKVGPEVLLRVTGKDYAEWGFVRGRLVNGKVVLENLAPHDAKLINDHLEWSATHRMWARRSASSISSLLTCSA